MCAGTSPPGRLTAGLTALIADQTRLLSEERWVSFPFRADQLRAAAVQRYAVRVG